MTENCHHCKTHSGGTMAKESIEPNLCPGSDVIKV